MNYELVKKLKDAGFPQSPLHIEEMSMLEFKGSVSAERLEEFKVLGKIEELADIYVPTLSELIKACGRGFWGLRVWTDVDKNDKDIEGYQAMDNWHDEEDHCDGIGSYFEKTPEEAVAKLWLALKLNNRLDS